MRPILKIFIPYFAGISIALSAGVSLENLMGTMVDIVLLTILVFSIGLAIVFHLVNQKTSFFHLAAWFVVGVASGLQTENAKDLKHYSQINTDIFEARVEQVHQTSAKSSKFIRCELSMLRGFGKDGKHEVSGKMLAFIDTSAFNAYKRNDIIVIQSQPILIRNNGNPGEFDLKLFWNSKGFTHQVFLEAENIILKEIGLYHESIFDKLRKTINGALSKHLNGDIFAVSMGILLGDKSYLNLELKDAFSGAGAMHLLAVSGLHVGIFLVILQWLFKTFGRKLPRWLQFTIILSILWTYAGVTGFSPSVNRAVTMFSFVALGTLFGKKYDSINGLLAAAMLLLLYNPYYLLDIGFELSFGAMFGILLLSKPIERSLYIKNKIVKFIWSGTAVALAAQITTFPLTLYYFHQFPNYFLVTNLGLMLISGLMMAVGLGLISFASLPFLGYAVALLFTITVGALIAFVEWVSKLPFALTLGFRLALWEAGLLYVSIVFIFFAILNAKKSALYIGLGLLVFFIGHQSAQNLRDHQNSEILVLNTNDPTFFIRRGSSADLMVISNKEDIEKRTEFLKRSLTVYYGIKIKIHFISRKNGIINTNRSDMKIHLKTALIHIELEGRFYTLFYGDYFKNEDLVDAIKLIACPWVSKNKLTSLVSVDRIWMLRDKGAFRIDLR